MKNIAYLFYLVTCFSFAQNSYTTDSFRASKQDITANTCALDSTANAVLIYEHGSSRVRKDDYHLNFEYQNKTKILKRDGFDKTNITIHLYKSKDKRTERVRNIKPQPTTL